MPRIKPARTLEEINAVPQDKSVTISLEPEGTIVLDKDGDEEALKAQEAADRQRKAKTKEADEDDNTSDLKQQLEDMRKANKEQTDRFNQEVNLRQAAEQRVRERDQEVSQSKIRAEDAEYDAILNAIGAAESEAETAQRDISIASEAQDPKGIGEASRRLARAEGRLAQLEDGKAAIERAKTTAAARAKEQPQREPQKASTVDQYIDQLPNLLPSQRDWLREHPDALTDTRKNLRLQGAHVEAEDQGLRPGTVRYFNYLEERLGYKEKEDMEDDDDSQRQYLDAAAPQVSAPPSRSATNPGTGRPSNTRITLTPEQREVARLSGIDEITYARQLQKMNELKASGHLQ